MGAEEREKREKERTKGRRVRCARVVQWIYDDVRSSNRYLSS